MCVRDKEEMPVVSYALSLRNRPVIRTRSVLGSRDTLFVILGATAAACRGEIVDGGVYPPTASSTAQPMIFTTTKMTPSPWWACCTPRYGILKG